MSDAVSEKEERLQKAISSLNEKEFGALRYFHANKQVALSDAKGEELYQLFKNGKSCDEIRKLNPSYTLGQIVAARIAGDWDARLAGERGDLLDKLPGQVMHVQGEAVDFLARLIAVNHKLYNKTIDKFLQTGDESLIKDLPFGIGQIKEYRALIESLSKVTGQSNRKVVEHRGTVDINTKGPVTQEQAGNILDVLATPIDDEK